MYRKNSAEIYCLYANQKQIDDLSYIFEKNSFRKIEIEDVDSEIKNFIVICLEKRNCEIENILTEHNLTKGVDFDYVFNFAKELNYLYTMETKRKIAFWGAGDVGKKCLQEFTEGIYSGLHVDKIIDNNALNIKIQGGVEVIHPSMIVDWKDYYIILTVNEVYDEIESQLNKLGLMREHDYIGYKTAMRDVGKLFLKTFFENHYSNQICYRPFGFTDVIADEVLCCCPIAMDYLSLGNLRELSFRSVWHSMVAKIIRLSILNGTYSFCTLEVCDKNIEFTTNKSYNGLKKIKTEDLPQDIMLGVDNTCNLSCPSCRKCVTALPIEILNKRRKIVDEVLDEIQDVERIWLAGDGEVFASQLYRETLLDERVRKRKRISILSNGTLFSKANFEKYLSNFQEIEVTLSIDGATKNTIETLRRGTDFEVLKKNFEFVGMLRENNVIQKLQVNFVLQSANIAELKEMISWCRANHVDVLRLLKLVDYHLYSEEEFDEMSIIDKDDQIKAEYWKYLGDEILNDTLIDWSTLIKYVPVSRKMSLFNEKYSLI